MDQAYAFSVILEAKQEIPPSTRDRIAQEMAHVVANYIWDVYSESTSEVKIESVDVKAHGSPNSTSVSI